MNTQTNDDSIRVLIADDDEHILECYREAFGGSEETDYIKVLGALEADYEFLLKGDVFTPDLLEAYIGYKREAEVDPMRMRPHPYEFTLYYDI